jgi:hypothetical protein
MGVANASSLLHNISLGGSLSFGLIVTGATLVIIKKLQRNFVDSMKREFLSMREHLTGLLIT